MLLRALVSFSGAVSMVPGEVRDVKNPAVARDLLRAGYAVKADAGAPEEPKKKKESAAPKKSKKKK